MSFAHLPTVAQVAAARRGPIAKGPSRLDVKTADDRDDARDEKIWRKACITRDGKVCRRCKRVVVVQLELVANRLEVHHVAGRVDRAVRWDVRNGITVCAFCHDLLTRHELFILQAAKHLFTVGQQTYLNAAKKVTFSDKAAL